MGYPEWSGKQDQGQEQVAEGANARTDGSGSQETAKKKKIRAADWTTERRCSVRRDDLWTYKKSSMAKKTSLRKTNKCQTEANDKVWSLNRDTEKALDTFEILHERFEPVIGDLANVVRGYGGPDKHGQRSLVVRRG